MSAQEHIPFFEMFSCCGQAGALNTILQKTKVITATVEKAKMAMKITLLLPEPVAPVDIAMIEEGIKAEFGLNAVMVSPVYPKSDKPERKKDKKKSEDTVLYGRAIKSSITPMENVTLELGSVTVRGEVFDVLSREITKRNAWVLSFDMTDYTNSLRISKFMTDQNAGEIAAKIKKGMYLTVSGKLGFNRYDGEMTLEPTNIVQTVRETRQDTAPEKRVELHLHTKMSAMDAVTDVSDAVRRAIEWGHPAIAITDHGVVQGVSRCDESGR